MQNNPREVLSDIINIIVAILIAIFAWQYAKHTKEIQTQANLYKLQECFSASTAFLKVYGVMWIITCALFLLGVFVGLALFISR